MPKTKPFKCPYAKQTKAVEALLLNEWKRREPSISEGSVPKVYVFTWCHDSAGLRVAEVSFTTRPKGPRGGMSGCSWMQCDTESVLFLAERLILEMKHKDFGCDDTDLYRGRLLEACFDPDTNP